MNGSNRISRYGAYGVVMRGSTLLLTQKKSGPYQGLWGLPGGAIEFGESPEETLRRELLEETALSGGSVTLHSVATATCQYDKGGVLCDFHQVGIIYRVEGVAPAPGHLPEEKMRWISLQEIDSKELTPFAQHVLVLDQVK